RLLLQMTPRKREALRNAWLGVEYRNGVDWNKVLRWGVPVLLVLMLGILYYGVILAMQQALTLAAEEGARAALRYQPSNTQRV
ncbi:pilus assembly protein, partial [Mycobacterium tuberculosis]|nr:pilus assembly protein [Mycobacterium tuberculosis]